jgi:hypothetical protein
MQLKLKNFEIFGARVTTLISWSEAERTAKNSEAVVRVVVRGNNYHTVANGYCALTAFLNALCKALITDFPYLKGLVIDPEKSDLITEREIAEALDEAISNHILC